MAWRVCLYFLIGMIIIIGCPVVSGDQQERSLGAGVSADQQVHPELTKLYPNPPTHGNEGEYIAITFTGPQNVSGWELHDDGRQVAELPAITVSGTVAFSHEPDTAAEFTDYPVYPLSGWLQLAVQGDGLSLKTDDGTTLDSVKYDHAPEESRYEREESEWSWVPVEQPDFTFPDIQPASAEAFVLPDNPDRIMAALRAAEHKIRLAGYTFESEQVTETLIEAHHQGVDVSVLVEQAPVGGMSKKQVALLDELEDAGIETKVTGGEDSRYQFHHAKYAVIDDTALIMTENWKPSGTGGKGSRGWGVLIEDRLFAQQLVEVFTVDSQHEDASRWSSKRITVDPVEESQADGSFDTEFVPQTVDVETAQLVVAPYDADEQIDRLLATADESIMIKQMSIEDTDFRWLDSAVTAAKRGVEVEILLSEAWYVQEENEALVDQLTNKADQEDIDLSITTAESGDNFEKIHTKGVIIDERHVVLGSINWNENSVHNNREIAVILTGDNVAEYYADVFSADMQSRWDNYPIILIGVTILTWGTVIAILAKRLEWI